MFLNPIYRLIFFLLFGSTVATIFFVTYRMNSRIEENGIVIKGFVQKTIEYTSHDDINEYDYLINYTFQEEEYEGLTTPCKNCEVGDSIDIIVNQQNPSEFKAVSSLTSKEILYISIVIYAITLLFSLWNLRRYLRWKRKSE